MKDMLTRELLRDLQMLSGRSDETVVRELVRTVKAICPFCWDAWRDDVTWGACTCTRDD